MAVKNKIVSWVVVGPEPYFATCKRCGATISKPSLPWWIDAFLSYMQYASDLHANCKEATS